MRFPRVLTILLVISLSTIIGVQLRSGIIEDCVENPFRINLTVFLPQRETELRITTCTNCSFVVEVYDLESALNGERPLLTRNATSSLTLKLLPYSSFYLIKAGPYLHELCIRQHGVEKDNLLYSEVVAVIATILLAIELIRGRLKLSRL
ncbi:hypothetical protein [Candidatus Methanodesulfokora washburnensis]|uniref:Uncharacterized protein n=1 Tax=Candidatus Methanodesulfokora washburnensis TaxID=2478471 RepID=A0A429GD15_9CREN|nr:hypothetical protein [Candidatus Methanodesulfokores washburnensis]RSN71720.1 hypothetical protein D6D85_15415 [Candidatus Methanodesulfokores washburnensis]